MRIVRGSLRGTLGWIYVLAAAIPLLLLTLFSAFHGGRQWEQQQRRLGATALQAWNELDEQLTLRVGKVQLLARELELGQVPMGPAVSPWLDAARELAPGFTSMVVADASGRVVASSPPAAIGRSVADRPYFTELAAGAPWFISDAFRGRVLGSAPIAAVSAPVHDAEGRFAGIVEGSMQLERFAEMERRFTGVEGLRLVLVDGARAIVYGGSDRRFQSLELLRDSALVSARSGSTFVHQDPETGERWLVAPVSSADRSWRVLAMQPVSVFVSEWRRVVISLAVAAVWSLMVVIIGLRRVLSRAVEPVEQLAAEMRRFDFTVPPPRLVLPRGTPLEIVELTRTFETMAERTRRVITGLVPICAQCKRIRDEHDNWEPVETFVRERSEAEFTHGLCPECAHLLGFVPAQPKD